MFIFNRVLRALSSGCKVTIVSGWLGTEADQNLDRLKGDDLDVRCQIVVIFGVINLACSCKQVWPFYLPPPLHRSPISLGWEGDKMSKEAGAYVLLLQRVEDTSKRYRLPRITVISRKNCQHHLVCEKGCSALTKRSCEIGLFWIIIWPK